MQALKIMIHELVNDCDDPEFLDFIYKMLLTERSE